MLRRVDRACKPDVVLTAASERRYALPEPTMRNLEHSNAVRSMNSYPSGGAIDSAGEWSIESTTPHTKQVSHRQTRLRSLFRSPLCMVLVALGIRLVVMGFGYHAQVDHSLAHRR